MINRDKMLIEADELKEIIGKENIRIFDASVTDGVYVQEHIPGAAFLTMRNSRIPTAPTNPRSCQWMN
jgi:3-mercaptopyruvate sulfurtransferase SseA